MEQEPVDKQEMAPDTTDQEIDDGLGLLIKDKTLYHGSGVTGIKKFTRSENETLGSGLYLTSEAKDAAGYAKRRARREKSNPIVYQTQIENVKLMDLRKDENIGRILGGFREKLAAMSADPNLDWLQEGTLKKSMEAIDSGKIGSGNLREVTYGVVVQFSDYLKSLGYDGLVAIEGGEGEDVGDHDSYLIFDPEKAQIKNEQEIK